MISRKSLNIVIFFLLNVRLLRLIMFNIRFIDPLSTVDLTLQALQIQNLII